MPTFNTADDQARYALVPFDEAIAYLGGKISQDTDKWDDLATPQEHDAAFVVAGMKGALLQDIRVEVERAIREGKSREDFKKEFYDIVDRRGWSSKQGNDWRSSIIYQTNLRQAYGDGRCRQMADPDVVGARPYRMWVHGDSRVPRPEHRAMNGKVFRHDHPVASVRLPIGFGCKCTWVTLSERDMRRRGLAVENSISWGSIIPTAKGDRELKIETGFGARCVFESEEDRKKRKQRDRQEILGRLSPDHRRDAIREIAAGLAGAGADANRGISAGDLLVPGSLALLTGIGLIPIPIGTIQAAATAAGATAAQVATMPLGLYLPSLGLAKVAEQVRRKLHQDVADKLRDKIRRDRLDELAERLKGKKENPLTIVVGRAGDNNGQSSSFLAQRLKKEGLLGNVIATANPINTRDDLDIFTRSLQVYQQSLDLAEDSIMATLALAIENGADQINFVSHSAGSAIVEDIAGILNELGIEVDRVVSLGGITLPPNLGKGTKYRRYISDIDGYQLSQKLAVNPAGTDRFYKGVYHGTEEVLDEMGARGLTKTWLGNRQVLADLVADLNILPKPVRIVPTQRAIEFETIPDVTKDFEPPKLAELPAENLRRLIVEDLPQLDQPVAPKPKPAKPAKPPKPNLRKVEEQELAGLRQASKRELPFRIRINKNPNGTFNVQPTKADGYVWKADQAQLVADYLRAKGVYLPPDFDPNNRGWQEGFNYLRIEQNPEVPLDLQPAANLVVQTDSQRTRAKAYGLQQNLQATLEKLESVKRDRERALDRLGGDLEGGEQNPFVQEIVGRFDQQIKGLEKRARQQQAQIQGYILDADRLDEYERRANTVTDIEDFSSTGAAKGVTLLAPQKAREIRAQLTDLIDQLPQLQRRLDNLRRTEDQLAIAEDLARNIATERQALGVKRARLLENLELVEGNLAKGDRPQSEIDLRDRLQAQLIDLNTKLPDLQRLETAYREEAKTLRELIALAGFDAKDLQIEIQGVQAKINQKSSQLYQQLQVMMRLDRLRTANPGGEDLVPADKKIEPLLIPETPQVQPDLVRRYVRRAYADKYAAKIGGRVLVETDANGKKIFVVVPPGESTIDG